MNQPLDLEQLAQQIKQWGQELGFQQVGITDTNLLTEEPKLQRWLAQHYHGDMAWMAKYGMLRARPQELLPGTLRVISVRMDYLPQHAGFAKTLRDPYLGYISRYALGRDYHKLLRQRLKKLGNLIHEYCEELNYRPFVDSAPLLERPLAAKAGLGWVGKHSLLIHREAGSWFFLGELLINLPLPVDSQQQEQCGSCVACITICPTRAIVAPYVIDARRCISYLTIELEGAIPEELRPLIGNRIYGCDDCQLICPWNRYSQLTKEQDFSPRHDLQKTQLVMLFSWSKETFLNKTEGSAIRRIGYMRWLRNIAVALGNAPYHEEIVKVLQKKQGISALLDEHIAWALIQQQQKKQANHLVIQSAKKYRLIRSIEKGLPRDA